MEIIIVIVHLMLNQRWMKHYSVLHIDWKAAAKMRAERQQNPEKPHEDTTKQVGPVKKTIC